MDVVKTCFSKETISMLDPNLKSMRSFYMNANIELPLIALNLAPKPLCCKAKVVVVFYARISEFT